MQIPSKTRYIALLLQCEVGHESPFILFFTGCNILVKAEFANPSASVKDRAALYLIKDAEEKGFDILRQLVALDRDAMLQLEGSMPNNFTHLRVPWLVFQLNCVTCTVY